MLPKLLTAIREQALLRAGDHVGVAVSGGADSVALLRALIELRSELGILLSVVHVHHGIRGAEADADQQFVSDLAKQYGLPFHTTRVDAPAYAREHGTGLEGAARHLRYEFFQSLIAGKLVDKVATAHTHDDQAETVLLRLLRGSGPKGLAGIRPVSRRSDVQGPFIRPMLQVRRSEVIAYLHQIGQPWCEDVTNEQLDILRNRVRHELLPLLERDYNPAVREALVNLAEIQRDEDEFLDDLSIQNLSLGTYEQVFGAERATGDLANRALKIERLKELPVALQRRVIRYATSLYFGRSIGFDDVEAIRAMATNGKRQRHQIGTNLTVERRRSSDGKALLLFSTEATQQLGEHVYSYTLPIPGEVLVPEVRTVVRATLVHPRSDTRSYNPDSLVQPDRVGAELLLRNWRAGDRYHALHTSGEEKLKRMFQEKRITRERRALWPVLVCGERVVWAKGFPVAVEFAAEHDGEVAVLIEAEEQPVQSTDGAETQSAERS